LSSTATIIADKTVSVNSQFSALQSHFWQFRDGTAAKFIDNDGATFFDADFSIVN